MFPVSQKHRELIYYRAGGNLRSEASKTYLSFSWWVIEPVLSMVIYYLVFSVIMKRGTEDFVPFLLIGLVAYQWFSSVVSQSSQAIVSDRAFVVQACFPKVILPSVMILMGTLKFSVVLLILLIFLWLYGFLPTLNYAYLPLILLVQFFLISGCSYLFSLITVYVPDFSMILPMILRMLMFLSGVFYSVERLPEVIQTYFYLNPVATLIMAYRDVLMYDRSPDLVLLGMTASVAVFMYVLGVYLLRRYDAFLPRVLLQR